jgi:hypothetical protein
MVGADMTTLRHILLTLGEMATFPLIPVYTVVRLIHNYQAIEPTKITVLSDGTTRKYYNESGECIRTWEIKPVRAQLEDFIQSALHTMMHFE